MENYLVIGLMSGTSLDGLDIALCKFQVHDNKWSFEILQAETRKYSNYWLNQLTNIHKAGSEEFLKLHFEYGHLIGDEINLFMQKLELKADFIASHGHTIFHNPKHKYTVQIGDGNAIAAKTRLPVVFDFRSKDVALGGQGAPLVPIGDRLLFAQYDYCLNLGGIANISYDSHHQRMAFDICPANQVLNSLSNALGNAYDNKGIIASQGNLNIDLLDRLNSLEYYNSDAPKSLGKEWVDDHISQLLKSFSIPIKDKLRTFTEHIALQITAVFKNRDTKVLISGGGAYNCFLIDRIRENTSCKIIIPDNTLIEYKEAMIFALLGILRMRNEVNCLSSVTGASNDSCSGLVTL